MPEAYVTAAAMGGRGLHAAASGTTWVSPHAIGSFADRHHKSLRYLNRGSLVTGALVDAVLRSRWGDREEQPDGLALVVGSAFGNQGETTRYFRAIAVSGPDQVPPMASYDVAVNAFVNFCSIFFRCTGVVQMLSSGAVSGTEAMAAALSLLEEGEASAVLVAGVEHDSPEAWAYCGAAGGGSGAAESGVVMLLERGAVASAPLGRVLGAATGFAPPGGQRPAAVLAALVGGMASAVGVDTSSLAVLSAGPPWIETAAVAARRIAAPRTRLLDSGGVAGRWQLGSAGLVGSALVLSALAGSDAVGASMVADPLGWVGAVMLAGEHESPSRREEGWHAHHDH
jgi:3-oxoacyl-[acyl-carrier-protein] synthase II